MEERKYRYSITTLPFNEKLEKKRFGRIKKAISNTESSIKEFSKLIERPNPHVWSGGVFKDNWPSNENWLGSNMIGLDFDTGEQTIEEIYEIFKEFGITPTLYYFTFSDTPGLRKFRIVLFFDEMINDIKIYGKIMNSTEKILKIDTNCKDPARVFYGGDGVTITNPKPIPLQQFIDFLNINITARDNNNTRSIIGYSPNTANLPQSLFYYNKDYPFLAQIDVEGNPSSSTSLVGRTKIDLEAGRDKVKIWDEFLNGEWLYHDQLFPLATNLQYIEGGFKMMKNTMEHFNSIGKTSYTENNFAILPYVKKRRYYPVPIHKFSPYPEDADHYDFISALTNKRGHITVLKQKNKITLQDASEKFKEKFDDVIMEEEINKTHLILVPTAMGKTEYITNVEKSVIALPTHDLKNELKERIKTDFTFSPDSMEFEGQNLQKKLKDYYKKGLATKAMKLIHLVAEGKHQADAGDKISAAVYLYQLDKSNNINVSLLTTHKRIVNSDFNHSTVIFDEDPLTNLVEIQKTSIRDLSSLIQLHDPIKSVVEHLKQVGNGIYCRSSYIIDIDDLADNGDSMTGIQSNVIDFFRCSFFILENEQIHYIVKRGLPTGKKNIILSATLSPYIYEKLYPELNFEIFNISNVEQVGKVIQYTGRSCSRSGLEKYGDEISKEIGDKITITFKGYKDKFINADEQAYFGNCSGYNHLRGKNVVVVGTPHRSNIVYFLLAKLMNVDFDIMNSPMSFQKVRYNDYEFMFNSFENKDLQKIQLSLIESDLIQAVGRARSLRENCIVELYSNFPLDVTTEFHIKKPI
ncbi:hypothetical protein SAMN05421638_2193 [Kaistella treverensis]|uniref:Uncharacterized protein n=1 Tax=Kaistella treverensis TaxID=631455 RepID=A0A1I3NNV3_9FLAO|nr:hypothetical protein [Kaistella treverensis]SFJ10842.1 hypothetical protein SAMN05421638_2193 [Kaistella treverensis]